MIKAEDNRKLIIFDIGRRGWIQCPYCNAHRPVDSKYNVEHCSNCGDNIFWNLCVQTL
jgi:hypothetical protein